MEANWAAPAPGAMAQWYVNGQGQTMVAIPDPGKPFLMGSPLTEPARENWSPRHGSVSTTRENGRTLHFVFSMRIIRHATVLQRNATTHLLRVARCDWGNTRTHF